MALDPTDIEYGLSLLAGRQQRDLRYHSYYEGDVDLSFIPSRARSEVRRILKGLNYNRCRTVVDAIADRTTVTGWKSEGDGNDTTIQRALTIWDRNRMDNRQNEIVKEAFRCADGYVIVWPDGRPGPTNGLARIYPNRSHVVTVVYDSDEPDHVAFALKCWRVERGPDKGKWRLTTYEPDVLTRYITSGKTDTFPVKANKFTTYTDEDETGPETENPYGVVPVIHFGNDADTGGYGTSELADVVGLQDGLNNSIINRVIGEEYVSFRQKWAAGIEVEEDPVTGQKIAPFQNGMDKLWIAEDPNARFGDFSASDMTQFLAIEDNWDLKIARVSRVPIHWLNQSGSFPSGESLKTAEAPFVSKVRDRQLSFTDPYRQVMALALRIEGVADDQATAISPVWMSPESRSEREKYELAQFQKSLGIPDEKIWGDLGYSPEEIVVMLDQKQAAAQRQQEMFAASFDRGQTLP